MKEACFNVIHYGNIKLAYSPKYENRFHIEGAQTDSVEEYLE